MRKSLKRKSLKRKSLKRKSLKRNKSQKSRNRKTIKKRKLKGGGLVDEPQKTILVKDYKVKIKEFIEKNKIQKKNPKLLQSITKKIKSNGNVYDFIFETTNKSQITNLNSNTNIIIWSHGTKDNLEPVTAGKPGIHAYVQINGDNIRILGLVLTLNTFD